MFFMEVKHKFPTFFLSTENYKVCYLFGFSAEQRVFKMRPDIRHKFCVICTGKYNGVRNTREMFLSNAQCSNVCVFSSLRFIYLYILMKHM